MKLIVERNIKEIFFSRKIKKYYPKINLPIDINPPKFLDTKLSILNKEVITSVHRKESNLPIPWESKVPKHYKRNIIFGELQCAKNIVWNFLKEVHKIKEIFSKTNFSLRFINSVVSQFNSEMYDNNEQTKKMKLLFNLSYLKS